MHSTAGVALFLMLTVLITADAPAALGQSPEELQRIADALPADAYAKPQKPRRLLVFTLTRGFRHTSIPHGVAALEQMGRKTGAYQALASDDPAVFSKARLAEFDAVCFLSTTGELFDDPALRQNLSEWVRGGGGVAGIHAATDCFYKWPEFGAMMGGYFDGHPWHEKVGLRVEEPEHPFVKMFAPTGAEITDEIYQLKDPYSRKTLRVVLSLDTARTDMTKPGIHRMDGDFAVSWAQRYEKGRVFYSSLGHREEIFWNPTVLRHYLAGIQYALGDLAAADQPRP